MAALERYTAILGLFRHDGSGAWTVPDMAAALDAPVSTIYRHVRELTQAGLLEQSGEALYRLGPAFIEFERLLRLNDPLSQRAPAVLQALLNSVEIPALAILARLYNGEVMCIASLSAPNAAFTSSYERGRPMPLTRGATSKVILAQLPSRDLKNMIGPREENTALRNELSQIRRDGFFVTASEIDEGLAGIAVPAATGEVRIAASLTLVVQEKTLAPSTSARLIALALHAARQLTGGKTESMKPEHAPLQHDAAPPKDKIKHVMHR